MKFCLKKDKDVLFICVCDSNRTIYFEWPKGFVPLAKGFVSLGKRFISLAKGFITLGKAFISLAKGFTLLGKGFIYWVKGSP